MKYSIVLIVLAFQIVIFAQSQMELNLEAKAKYTRADEELNKVYQAILEEYAEDKDFIRNLRTSERIWIKFRDAEMLMKYPESEGVRQGSVFPLCYFSYLTKLTEERTTTLRQWIDGEPEGEVCSGSVYIK